MFAEFARMAAVPACIGDVEGYVRCPPGETLTGLRRGDLVFVRGNTRLSQLIHFFAWLRFRHDDLRWCYWSHVAVVIDDQGYLVDVDVDGVGLCHIDRYRELDFCYVRLRLTPKARREIATYAHRCAGQRYGIAAFVLLGLSVLSGGWLPVPDSGKPGCVSLIVRALRRAGLTFDRSPAEMMPADLAKRFGVLP